MKIIAFFFIISLSVIALITVLFVKLILRAQTIEAKIMISKLRKNKNIDESFRNFPKYYINLDRSEDRRKNMENEIKEYKLQNIKRIKAFDGKEFNSIKEGKIDGYSYYNNDTKRRKAELAISMSHLKAIKRAYEDGNKYALIMEDDIEMTLVPHWDKNIDEIIEEIPKEAELILLSTWERNKNQDIVKAHNYQGKNGVAYIITYKGMKKLEKYYQNNKFDLTDFDNITWDFGIMEKLNFYYSRKSFFLLFNFKYGSTNGNHNKNQIDCPGSYKILKSYSYNKVAS